MGIHVLNTVLLANNQQSNVYCWSLGPGPWSRALGPGPMVPGPGPMVPGPWSIGPRALVQWSQGPGPLVPGPGPSPKCLPNMAPNPGLGAQGTQVAGMLLLDQAGKTGLGQTTPRLGIIFMANYFF